MSPDHLISRLDGSNLGCNSNTYWGMYILHARVLPWRCHGLHTYITCEHNIGLSDCYYFGYKQVNCIILRNYQLMLYITGVIPVGPVGRFIGHALLSLNYYLFVMSTIVLSYTIYGGHPGMGANVSPRS
jgi:hypothetical protein